MRFRHSLQFGVLMILTIFFVCIPNNVFAEESKKNHILIIQSYDAENEWENGILQGINTSFKKNLENFNVDVEYMDMKKHSGKQYYEKLAEFYEYKYSNKKYDVIMVVDNSALEFINIYHNKIFRETPVVFCGVNGFKDSIIAGKDFLTGVVDEVDLNKTIDIALKQNPKAKEINIILGNTLTGNTYKDICEKISSNYNKKYKFNISQLDKLTEAEQVLKKVSKNSVVLLIGNFRDNYGDYMTYSKVAEALTTKSYVPIYGAWDFLLGHGIVGGATSSAEHQGELAADVAIRIIKGEKPSNIKVIMDRCVKYTFDYKAMKKFNISKAYIPLNSLVINEPCNVYHINKILIACLSTVTVVVISIIAFNLINSIAKRKTVENELNETLEYDKIKTEFFANMSHELKTPLNVIFSTTQLLQLYLKQKQIIENGVSMDKNIYVLKQNCFRLLRLVNNLIDITKLDSGYIKAEFKNRNIVSVIEDITLSVAQFIENKDINLIFDTEVEEKVMACDEDKIERIMLNLLSNAIKFTPKGGQIMVNIYDKKDKIEIHVKDTGIGIPEDKQKMIFERFRQVDKSLTRNREGSGIGLSLVKSLVDLHNGDIHIQSEYGKGSDFIVEIPVILMDEPVQCIQEKAIKQSCVERISVEFSDIYS